MSHPPRDSYQQRPRSPGRAPDRARSRSRSPSQSERHQGARRYEDRPPPAGASYHDRPRDTYARSGGDAHPHAQVPWQPRWQQHQQQGGSQQYHQHWQQPPPYQTHPQPSSQQHPAAWRPRGNEPAVASSASHHDIILSPPLHIRRQEVDRREREKREAEAAAAVVSTASASSTVSAVAGASAAPASSPGAPSASQRDAFVTLVMLGDSYVPGALVLASSLRQAGSRAARVVLVSPDVSAGARADLLTVFDEVIEVPIIEGHAVHQEWKRYTKGQGAAPAMYQWIDKSFTKAHLLGLTQYRRVCLLDADMLCVSPPDGIFQLAAPAGICSTVASPAANEALHGRRLTQQQVEDSWRSYGMRGCLYMLEPNPSHLSLLLSVLKEFGGYGEKRFYIGADEKLFTDLYLDAWTHAHWSFGSNSWKSSTQELGREAVFLHYVTEKPWRPKEVWPDTIRWSEHATQLCDQHPKLTAYFASHFEAVRQHQQKQTPKR